MYSWLYMNFCHITNTKINAKNDIHVSATFFDRYRNRLTVLHDLTTKYTVRTGSGGLVYWQYHDVWSEIIHLSRGFGSLISFNCHLYFISLLSCIEKNFGLVRSAGALELLNLFFLETEAHTQNTPIIFNFSLTLT